MKLCFLYQDSNELSDAGGGAEESSAEWEGGAEGEGDSDDEEEGSGGAAWDEWNDDPPTGIYVGSVNYYFALIFSAHSFYSNL